MVRKELTDFSLKRFAIQEAIIRKTASGHFNTRVHDLFGPSAIKVADVDKLLLAIEHKLRRIESIYYTFFDSSYDSRIIVNNSMSSIDLHNRNKVIETEFRHGTSVLKNRIEISDPSLYKELIDMNFQYFVLTTANLYEILVKLCEMVLKKIVLYDGKKLPYASVNFVLFFRNWEKLIELNYRSSDDFYSCFSLNDDFITKYVSFIITLRNSFIHGYSVKIDVNRLHGEYVIICNDSNAFPITNGIMQDMVLNTFVRNVYIQTQSFIENFLNVLERKLSHGRTRFPM